MKSLWQEGQWPTLSQSSLACGWGGVRAESPPGSLPSNGWGLASSCPEAGAGPGLSKWPVRALDVVPGRREGPRAAGRLGAGTGQGWDPGPGAWPSALI